MSKIAYTIGHRASYDESLIRESVVMKIGRRLKESPPYLGGSVWPTIEEAIAFIRDDNIIIDGMKRDACKFAVYEIILPTGWEVDVSSTRDSDLSGSYSLLNDAPIIRKIWEL